MEAALNGILITKALGVNSTDFEIPPTDQTFDPAITAAPPNEAIHPDLKHIQQIYDYLLVMKKPAEEVCGDTTL